MRGRAHYRWLQLSLIFSLCLTVLLTGSVAKAAWPWQKAQVRVVHASPDGPAVDVYLNGKRAVTGLAYQKATDYLKVKPGRYRIQVTPSGASPDKAVLDAKVVIKPGKDYTIAAVGNLKQIKPMVLMDKNQAPAEGKAHIRLVHASPDAPAVDVAVTGGPVLVKNLKFPSASEYIPVKAGAYSLEVRPAGTTDVVLAVPGFKADAGNIYTVFVMGEAEEDTLKPVPFVDASFAK